VFALSSRRRQARRESHGPGLIVFVVILFLLVSASHHPAKGGGAAAGAGTPATVTDVRASGAAATAIRWAEQQVGCPYVYGGTGPCAAGFDCSGLMQASYADAGVSIPRTSEDDWAQLPHVSMSRLRPGDLLLYTGGDPALDPPPGHVVMFIGGGKVIEAYATGYPVRIDDYIPGGAWGAVRPS
jgi:cell wall-associated NlpC family hydrolase